MTLELEKSEATPRSAENPFVEKRRDVRYATCEAVEVCVLEVPSRELASRRLAAILRDVSRNGLRIEFSMPVKAGARLEILLRDRAIIFGTTCYCRRDADTFQVGVVIEDIYYPKRVSTVPARADERSVWQPVHRRVWIDKYFSTDYTPLAGRDRDDSVRARFLGGHVSRNELHSFLDRDLSETKTALIERHLASCEQCSDSMRLILAGQDSQDPMQIDSSLGIDSSFGRVAIGDPTALAVARGPAAGFAQRSAAPEKIEQIVSTRKICGRMLSGWHLPKRETE
jgi:hypothetical protein